MPEQEVNPFAEIENPGQPENTQNTPKDRLKEITEGIEQGIKDLFASDRYAEYLRVMSRFHHYSVNKYHADLHAEARRLPGGGL